MGSETAILSQLLNWLTHPFNNDVGTVKDWFAFLVLVLIVSFLWSTVIRETVE